MSEEQILGTGLPEEVLKLIDWVPKKRYLDLYKFESNSAIRERVKRGHWKPGVEYSIPQGSDMWISLRAVNAWAAKHVGRERGPSDSGKMR